MRNVFLFLHDDYDNMEKTADVIKGLEPNQNTRIFTVSVGDDVNKYFARSLANYGNGFHIHVDDFDHAAKGMSLNI